MSSSVADLRKEYTRDGLHESDAQASPFEQFRAWFDEAMASDQVMEPNAMTLSTATPQGAPSARIVLLKGFDAHGFVFYTNYDSRKGRELDANPQAALTFHWDRLERQVRIEGTVERIAPEASDAYFQSRPRGSRLGAWTSPQSQEIADRTVLTDRLAAMQERFTEDEPVPRPPHWGGYRVRPHTIEFWQGRRSRLHDRLCYRVQEDQSWTLVRLAP